MTKRKFYIETYGCQMNVADSQLVSEILTKNNFEKIDDYTNADLIIVNTCSVRQNAEDKVLQRLNLFTKLKKQKPNLKVGVIGCMAQRLKEKLLEYNKNLDLVLGPDSYRRIIENIEKTYTGNRITDTILNKFENYDDIITETFSDSKVSAFVTISRGCDNMCSFCIVPFTRGRERSRNPQSILTEISKLRDNGYKEITLLGQNVDKYNWNNELNFAKLLKLVATQFPDLRIRFATSYPQDMTDEVLYTIAENENICHYIHLPVQSGSNRILELMKRGYTREKYLERIDAIRRIIPDCAISTDIIAGFCTETEEDHQKTLSLMKYAKFDYAYMFKYSERPNTYAARNLPDNVPEETKLRRLQEIIDLQNQLSYESNKSDLNKTFEILVEGTGKFKSQYFGRNSQNKVIVFDSETDLIGKIVKVQVYDFTQATLFGKLV